jgi:ketosteroid isomerase-like protein
LRDGRIVGITLGYTTKAEALQAVGLTLVERAIAAVNERDVERYLTYCTEDIELRTPLEPITGVYEGGPGVRRFFADVEDAGTDFRLDLERLEAIGEDRVLAFLRVSARGRASGIPQGAETANVYDIVEGKIGRIRIFLDRQEALEAVGLRE